MQTVFASNDFDFIIVALNDASLEITKKQGLKREEICDRIEVEIQWVEQALQSSRVVSIVPLPSGEPKLGVEPAQIHRLDKTVEAHLR